MTFALTPASVPLLPSFRRQQLLLEFSSLKLHCPEGIYLTPSPNDPSIWSGVYFVREGPYTSGVLRFEILFPPSYPEAPPLVIFSTELFHPLLVPLTTYTFSPGATDPTATYSASEVERLPPGALSLRYRFPQWFPIKERGRTIIRVQNQGDDKSTSVDEQPIKAGADSIDEKSKIEPATNKTVTIQLLDYVKSAFEDEAVLDQLPLEAAGNANAWYAWRAYREPVKPKNRAQSPPATKSIRSGASPRNPADWNWDGVWEARVEGGISESISDTHLFSNKIVRGNSLIPDSIRFMKIDDDKLAGVQDDMLRMHGFAAGVGR